MPDEVDQVAQLLPKVGMLRVELERVVEVVHRALFVALALFGMGYLGSQVGHLPPHLRVVRAFAGAAHQSLFHEKKRTEGEIGLRRSHGREEERDSGQQTSSYPVGSHSAWLAAYDGCGGGYAPIDFEAIIHHAGHGKIGNRTEKNETTKYACARPARSKPVNLDQPRTSNPDLSYHPPEPVVAISPTLHET